MKTVDIPKAAQLEALADGLASFYSLIEKYAGHPFSGDFRSYASVSKEELAAYFSLHQGLAEKHVVSNENALKRHDLPALIQENDQWIACWIDRKRLAGDPLPLMLK